ncbi:hypothetical protein HZB02_03185 [Candidatus Woesearchaeota archaeon]|nr:hypothetical protein [Candidatus Woesearchaeota archaeon]
MARIKSDGNGIPLPALSLEDTSEIKKIKTLKGKEEEYSYLLAPIEHAIAAYYAENRMLKDKNVVSMLKNLKTNYASGLAFFKEPLEREIVRQLTFSVYKKKTTRRELMLAFSYILWCIDNRSWTGDSRAYLDWVLNLFGMMPLQEKRKFQKDYQTLGKKFGIDPKKIKVISAGAGELGHADGDIAVDEDDDAWALDDSKYFAMSDGEKCEFFLKAKDEMEQMVVLQDLLTSAEENMKNQEFGKSLRILHSLLKGNLQDSLREVVSSMMVECFICMEDFKEAEKAITDIIILNKDYPMAYFHRAVIAYKENNLPVVITHLDKCISIAEKVGMRHPQFYTLKAEVLKKQGDDGYRRFEKMAQEAEKTNIKRAMKMAKQAGMDPDDIERMVRER